MPINIDIKNFILSLIGSFILLKTILPILKKYFLVKPIFRSSHSISTPSAGGISFVSIISLFGYFNNFLIPIYCLPLSIVGFVDDKNNIKPIYRIIFQIASIFLLLNNSNIYNHLQESSSGLIYYLILFFIIFSSLACINFINFGDGLDGLLSGCMIVIFSTLAISNPILLIIIGAIIGFIILNWSPAKVFMGDGGSTFLGALFLGILYQNNNFHDLLKILLLASPILGDILITLIIRIKDKKSIIKAHNSFIFQKLNRGGWSHQKVSLLYMFATLLISLGYIFGEIKTILFIILIELPILIYLEKRCKRT